MAYRINIIDAEASANGDVHMDVFVQKEVDSEWVDIPNGHRTLVMDGEAVLAITEGSGTDVQKRAALLELFKQEVISWGVHKSDEATTQLTALIPGGFPVSVTL